MTTCPYATKFLSPLRQWSAIRAEMQHMLRAAYTVQSRAVPTLMAFVFLSCRWFDELNL